MFPGTTKFFFNCGVTNFYYNLFKFYFLLCCFRKTISWAYFNASMCPLCVYSPISSPLQHPGFLCWSDYIQPARLPLCNSLKLRFYKDYTWPWVTILLLDFKHLETLWSQISQGFYLFCFSLSVCEYLMTKDLEFMKIFHL